MPAWIVDELAAALGPDDALDDAVAALNRPAPLAVRANRRRTDRDRLIATLEAEGGTVTASPHAAAGLLATGLGDPDASPSFRAGLWTVQDLGAQRVGELAAPAPRARILDACAGVGGKSTHLAELTDDRAAIDAADSADQKLRLAAGTARRLGLSSIRAVHCDLLDRAAPLAAAYDLVVLDAPCTGLGVLRRHPEAKWRLAAGDVPRMAALQAQLLDATAPRVAPGGALVYSVCTFTRAEGPEQVAAFLARTDFTLVAEDRTWPHRDEADAFYMARLVRPSR